MQEVWRLANSPWKGSAWQHAEKQWDLSYEEAQSLFKRYLTLQEIENNLEQLEIYYADS